MTKEEYDIMQELAPLYGIKISQVEEGKGGAFYCDANGKRTQLSTGDCIEEFYSFFSVQQKEAAAIYQGNASALEAA